MSDTMTQAEAARALGVSRQAVHNLIANGKLVGVPSRRGTLVTVHSVKRRAAWKQRPALGVPEVARRLGVNETTVRRRLAAGQYQGATLPDGTWVIDPASIAEVKS